MKNNYKYILIGILIGFTSFFMLFFIADNFQKFINENKIVGEKNDRTVPGYTSTTTEIINHIKLNKKSEKQKTLSKENAIDIVNQIPEIEEWKALFSNNGFSPKTGGTPHVIIWKEDKDFFYIHAYEEITAGEMSRNPTFGFYMINKRERSVYQQVLFIWN